ncbi:MAG: UDP-N-acetylmuramoyl-L-alanine--D-glutamate ligase [Chlamydiales bacterium]
MRALVLGLGISGRAAAEFLLARGFAVTAVEKSEKVLASNDVENLHQKGLSILPESEIDLKKFALFVPSPGVSSEHPLYLSAQKAKVEIIGEAELAFRTMAQSAVAITGTNGKTTVTLLVQHLLNSCGKRAKALGNVGEPLTRYFLSPDPDELVVAELSSYQLETISSRVFHAGVILNITPDHLDRYPSMREYAEAKCRLQNCLKPAAPFFVYEKVAHEFGTLLSWDNLFTFGLRESCHFWTDKEKIYEPGGVEYILPAQYRKMGEHESENLLAAWLLVKQFGVEFSQFVQALDSFKKPPHRIEFVREVAGVVYYDDSKGTNLDATIQAVRAMEGPVILIAGGVDKGASYTLWEPLFKGRVKKIIVLGEAAKKIARELESAFLIEMVGSLEDAVRLAYKEASRGDCVLLSPGCSSYDMFRDYAHRGEEFKRYVLGLAQ